MNYLLDTCVISEVIKREPNKNVISWLQAQDEANLFLSILTFGEIQKGIQKDPDQTRKKKLKIWLEEDLKKRFDNRIIPIDLKVVTNWGSIQGSAELIGRCRVPYDHIPTRSYPLFKARAILEMILSAKGYKVKRA